MADVPVVLVTGASGYVASHVVQQLLKSGQYVVRGTVRSLKDKIKVDCLNNLYPEATYPLELVEADLLDEESWMEAVKGCTYVLHTASPLPAESPKNPDDLIKPARDGTLYVLKACRASGTVKRVVVTSSTVTVTGDSVDKIYDEEDWADINSQTPYPLSKILAEKAAWDYVKELPDGEKFELATVLPSLVAGPPLSSGISTSQQIPKYLLERKMMMIPNCNLSTVDVRDVALAHIRAMTVPEAAGHRHIASNENLWFADIAKILDAEFKSQGYNVPTTVAPNFLIHIAGLFDSNLDEIKGRLGKVKRLDNSRLKNVLGINPIDMRSTIIDQAYAMIESGKVKKTSKYKGPPS